MPPNTISYVIACENIIRDKDSGVQTFTNIFDFIFMPHEKSEVVQSFYVAGRILNTPGGQTKIEINIFDPDNKIFQTENASGNLLQGDFNFSLNFKLVKFILLGKYKIQIKINDVICGDSGRSYITVIKRT